MHVLPQLTHLPGMTIERLCYLYRLYATCGPIIRAMATTVGVDKAPEELVSRLQQYLPEEQVSRIEAAYAYASQCHEGQTRRSGEPYVQHPLNTALVLADLRLDADTLCAALLHDVMEDCGITYQDLEKSFGGEVARLVDSVTKLTRMDYEKLGRTYSEDRLNDESLRKMLVAMANDVRVVLIKLADRLHNMQTLPALSPERQKAIAQETLDIYGPLAHRLGIWDMKWRLEDLAYRHLEPEKYHQISAMLATKRTEREEYVEGVAEALATELERANIKAQVTGRPKHIYSIACKIDKYEAQQKASTDIYDLYALRVLVDSKTDCYNALGTVHNLWRPIPGQFDDYIANHKDNMYQSLHTTVRCEGGVPLEVQIRTHEMHQVAEYGVAAHYRYKDGNSSDMRFEEKMAWLRQLLEWQREVTATDEFLETVKTDLFPDQVFVYTPKGDIVELPTGSTPLDFAYKIHTELGHRCVGAKVNGRLVSLDYQLKSGDTVEVVSTKVARGPRLDWLNTNLGLLKSASARQEVRQWFRRQQRGSNMQRGRELLRRELKRLGISMEEGEVAHVFGYGNSDEFLAALGSGIIAESQVFGRLTSLQTGPRPGEGPQPAEVPITSPTSGIQVLGVGDLLTRMGRCCNPLPGDEIVGFVTRTTGVTVHKTGCPNLKNEDEPERMVEVQWGHSRQLYPVRVSILAWDRVGLLSDVTTRVSAEGVNIASVITTEQKDGTCTLSLTVYVTGTDQLSRLFSKLEGVRGVIRAVRDNGGESHVGEKAKSPATDKKSPINDKVTATS